MNIYGLNHCMLEIESTKNRSIEVLHREYAFWSALICLSFIQPMLKSFQVFGLMFESEI